MRAQFPSAGKILIMDDEMEDVVKLTRQLEKDGFSVDYASTLRSAIEHLKVKSYDVAILDVLMEPGIIGALRSIFIDGHVLTTQPKTKTQQGFAVAKWLRQNQPEVGVIMLTDKFNKEKHVIYGLEAGADHYIAKNELSAAEFSARVRTLVRRCQPFSTTKATTRLFDLYIKPQMIMSQSGKKEYLTDAEFLALKLLISEGHRVVSRQEILDQAGLEPTEANGLRAADTLIKNIRDKLKRCGVDETAIHTRRGKGYLFHTEALASVMD